MPNGKFQEITWDDAIGRLAGKLTAAGGQVVAVSGAGRGTFSDLLGEWIGALGGRVVRYQPFAAEAMRAANRQVFGQNQLASYDFAKAKHIVSFGADFLESWPGSIEHQRGFAQSHGFTGTGVAKFVYLAPRRDLTGLNADEWYPVQPGSETALALAMANVVSGERGADPALRSSLAAFTPEMASKETGIPAATIRAPGPGIRRAAPQPGGRRRDWDPAYRSSRALRCGQPAQLRGRQRGRDRQLWI